MNQQPVAREDLTGMAQQVLFINDGTASLHTAYQALISRDIDVHLAHNLKEAESIFSTYRIQVVVFGAINGKANWRQIDRRHNAIRHWIPNLLQSPVSPLRLHSPPENAPSPVAHGPSEWTRPDCGRA